ncbi:hypothetical protein DOY81_008394, partial [Sarcophaga bullata]
KMKMIYNLLTNIPDWMRCLIDCPL